MAFGWYERRRYDDYMRERQTKITDNKTTPGDSMFSSPSATSDITLVVDGRNLHVSKCVLGLASPVFLKMFEGDFKDRTEIPLADKKYEDMVELLLCIYPSTNKKITSQNLDILLPLADEFEMDSLKQRCENFVLVQFQHQDWIYRNPPNQKLVHYLYLADKYQLKNLITACVTKLKFRAYEGKHGFKKLSEFSNDTKFQVLSARMSQLEVPVRALLVKAVEKPINNTIDYIANPDCYGCNRVLRCSYCSRRWCTGRKQCVADLKDISNQSSLPAYFDKDPSVQQ